MNIPGTRYEGPLERKINKVGAANLNLTINLSILVLKSELF